MYHANAAGTSIKAGIFLSRVYPFATLQYPLSSLTTASHSQRHTESQILDNYRTKDPSK